MSAVTLDDHLASCPDCARWLERATQVTRSARIGSADLPDLSDRILADVVLPARRVLRRRMWLRAALLVLGVAQLAIALPSVFGGTIDMAMSTHAAHEAAAWNLALGAAFVATAFTPRRAAGVLPLLTVFVGALALLSVRDLVDGAVAVGRLATHLGTVVGLVLIFALNRAEWALPPQRAPVAVDPDVDRKHGDGGLRGAA